MPEPLLRRRLTGATAALMLAGLVLAPPATSHDNPHGGPPGLGAPLAFANGHGSGYGDGHGHGGPVPPPGSPGAPWQPPGPQGGSWQPPAAHGDPHGGPHAGPPGLAKHFAPGPPLPAPDHHAGHSGWLPPGLAKNLPGSGAHTLGSRGHGNHGDHGSSQAPGQPNKQIATLPIITPASSPAAPSHTAAPPAPPTSTPAARPPATGYRPDPTRASPQRTSRRHARGHRTLRGGATSTGRGLGRPGRSPHLSRGARATHPAASIGSPAARASARATRSGHRSGGLRPQPTGHGAGPISSLIGKLIPVGLPVPDWSKPIILALLVICALLGLRAWLTARRAGRLENQRGRLAADLASLQPALVPDIPARFGPLAVSVAYRPADGPAAGGDFYDVFGLGGGRVAVIVGDVSGHGRAALTRAAHMRYMLRAYVETGLDPRSALKLAGRVLGADEEALFATVGIAVYDPAAATLTYATAGHPPPLLFGPAAHEPLSSCASPALGWGEPTGRRQTTVPFPEGARACFFSDGVTEVRVMDGLLGRGRVAAQLELSGSAADLLDRVQQQASSIRDDMAACIISARAGTASSEHRIEEFEVGLRHLESGQGDRFLADCGVPTGAATATLTHARATAADSGAALIRAELTGHTATASVGGSEPVSLDTPPGLAPADRADGRVAAARGWGAEATVGRTTTVVNQPPLD